MFGQDGIILPSGTRKRRQCVSLGTCWVPVSDPATTATDLYGFVGSSSHSVRLNPLQNLDKAPARWRQTSRWLSLALITSWVHSGSNSIGSSSIDMAFAQPVGSCLNALVVVAAAAVAAACRLLAPLCRDAFYNWSKLLAWLGIHLSCWMPFALPE